MGREYNPMNGDECLKNSTKAPRAALTDPVPAWDWPYPRKSSCSTEARFWLDSQSGVGSSFYFTLPVRPPMRAAEVRSSTTAQQEA
jgi:hypothetical protein